MERSSAPGHGRGNKGGPMIGDAPRGGHAADVRRAFSDVRAIRKD